MDVEETFAAMKANGVSTMRLQPVINGFSLRPYTLGKLMDAAADCRMPVFLNLHEELQPMQVYDLCQNYPHVRFVICNSGSAERRVLSPILDACPNLYLGTGAFPDAQWLQQLCHHWGVNRFLFDTGLPAGQAEKAVALVHDAMLSQEEKALIAWGNLENLLSEVTL